MLAYKKSQKNSIELEEKRKYSNSLEISIYFGFHSKSMETKLVFVKNKYFGYSS